MKVGAVWLISLAVAVSCTEYILEYPSKGTRYVTETLSLEGADCSKRAQPGDWCNQHYNGTLQNGEIFDTSYQRGRTFNFYMGTGAVILGMDMAMMGMCQGERRRIILPPELAYGSRQRGKIPAHSTLYFEVELVNLYKNGFRIDQISKPENCEPKVNLHSEVSQMSNVSVLGENSTKTLAYTTYSGNFEPYKMKIGDGKTIKGIDWGVRGMCAGEVRSITMPPLLALGDSGDGRRIPGKSTLVVDVALVEIFDACTLNPGVCSPHAKCSSVDGEPVCSCNFWMEGDGRTDGTGCTAKPKCSLGACLEGTYCQEKPNGSPQCTCPADMYGDGLIAGTGCKEFIIKTTFLPEECEEIATPGDLVLQHYNGTLLNGLVFDTSYQRDRTYNFVIGIGSVIKGIDQGMMGMCEGERRILIVPPALAYGSRSAGKIPPNSVLNFSVELNGLYKRNFKIEVLHLPENCQRRSRAGDILLQHSNISTINDSNIYSTRFNVDGAPHRMVLGANKLLKGIELGMYNMCVGEERRVTIPPILGLDDAGDGGRIPPNAVLILDVMLDEIIYDDECDSDPCVVGARCHLHDEKAVCICPFAKPQGDGLKSGSGCVDPDAVDYCKPNPCMRSAKCVSGESGATCVCQKGWYGDGLRGSTGCKKFVVRSAKRPLICRYKAGPGDIVHYHMNVTVNGNRLQSRGFYLGSTPSTLELALNEAAEGLERGITGMCVSERRRLMIPPALADGLPVEGNIPVGSSVLVDVEVTSIEPSGFKIHKTHKPEECPRVSEKGFSVKQHYSLRYPGEEAFDDRYATSEQHMVTIGDGSLTLGHEYGLTGMCEGEKRTVTIPASLGFQEGEHADKAVELRVELVSIVSPVYEPCGDHYNPCAFSATCSVVEGEASCECPPQADGDGLSLGSGCKKSICPRPSSLVTSLAARLAPKCTDDDDCDEKKKCCDVGSLKKCVNYRQVQL